MAVRDIAAAVASGAVLALSFPLPALSFLAWFALVPLLFAVSRKGFRETFRLAFITGITANCLILYWLNIVMTRYGGLHWSVSFVLFIVLASYLALYPALSFALARKCEQRGVPLYLALPSIWVALEFLRAYLFSGFPWASLGYTQYRVLPLIQLADLTGVYGLTFLIIFANVVIFGIAGGMAAKGKRPFPTAGFGILLGMLLLTLLYGFYRLGSPEKGAILKIGLTQGNIPQDVKWDPSFQERTVAVYEKLSREACQGGCDLVVWPESAAPFFFQESQPYSLRIKSLAAGLRTHLLIGSPAFEEQGGTPRFFNSAYMLSPDGSTLGRSDKIHLVPFGEYVPMGKLLPFVSKMVVGIGDFSPGEAAVPLPTGKAKAGVLICFEGIFPEISRDYVRAGARLLVNITNDAWFGRSSAPYQHLGMTVFRAVENRVPLVRAANTGISAIIDSRGHIRRMTPIFVETTLTGEIRSGEGGSVYTAVGDLFAGLCSAGAAAMVLFSFRRKTAAEPSRQSG